MTPTPRLSARIMIVEDDDAAARMLEICLRAGGYQHVGTVDNGQAAIRLAQSSRPDLVIMDIMLPGDLDGVEAADLIRARCDIPVLYLTAYSDDALFERARATAPLAYLTKPCEPRDLIRAIEVALDRHDLMLRLKASEAHLAEAQRLAHFGSWTWHIASNRVAASDELLRLAGLERGGFKPCPETFLQQIEAADRPRLLQAIAALQRGEAADDVEVRVPGPDGAAHVLRLRATAHFDADGNAYELVGTALDITPEARARQEAAAARVELEKRVAARTSDLRATNARLEIEIEERLRTEDSLRCSQERYRSLMDSLPDAVLVLQDGQVIFANPAAANLFDLPAPDALLGARAADLVHPDYLQICQQCQQAALSGQAGKTPTLLKLQRRDGRCVEVETLTFAFTFDGRGSLLAVMHDLTFRRQMEREAERFRVALDSLPDAVFLTDPEQMRFIDVNETASRSLGYSRDELLVRGPRDITPHFNKTLLHQRFSKLAAGLPAADVVQATLRRKDGSTFPVEMRLRAFVSEGRPLLVAVASDVSARQLAELHLRETNERFQQLADSVSEAFWIRDLAENRFLYVSPAYATLFGKSVASLYRHPRSFLAAVHPEDRDRVVAAYENQRRQPAGLDIEYRVVAGKTVRWLWVRTFPIRDKNGRFYRTSGIARDVTERRASEEQYRSIIQTAMDGFWVTDLKGRLLDCNDAACRISGYEREELLALSVPDLEAVETVEDTAEHIRKIITQGFDRFETRHRCKDGRIIDVDLSVYFSADTEDGRCFAFLRDISERKQAEMALQESRGDLNRAQSVGEIGSWRLDVRRNVLTWSAENHRLFGIPPGATLTYETFLNAVHPDDRDYVDREWRAALNGKPYDIEHRVLVDGQVKWVRERAELEFDANGHLLGGFGTTQNTTARKQAEAALRASEARFRLVFENAPIGIALAAQDATMIQVNQTLCDMLGYSLAELTGRTFISITHPDDIARNLELFRNSQTGELLVYQLRKRYLHRDGHAVWVDLVSTLIRDQTGAPLYSLGMMLDVTDRVNAEQARLLHEASQRAALVREVHHRIKNNLQGVIGLLRQHSAEHPEMQLAIEAAIAQVNTISVVHGLQSRLPQKELRLRELLLEIGQAAAALAMSPKLALAEDDLQADVWLDSNASVSIALVLNELIQNALKHGSQQDSAEIGISLAGDDRGALIRIDNPTAGLPPDFDFNAGKGYGTGLGLVRTLLPHHGVSLNITCNGGRVCAELALSPPVISASSEATCTPTQ